MTRDSLLWGFGMIGSVAVALAGNLHLFPWIPEGGQHAISLAAFVAGVVSGKLSTSPLPISARGRAAYLDADAAKRAEELARR